MDLRTSNMLACPTCRSCFSPDVNQLIKNFTILEAKNEGEKMFAEPELKYQEETKVGLRAIEGALEDV